MIAQIRVNGKFFMSLTGVIDTSVIAARSYVRGLMAVMRYQHISNSYKWYIAEIDTTRWRLVDREEAWLAVSTTGKMSLKYEAHGTVVIADVSSPTAFLHNKRKKRK